MEIVGDLAHQKLPDLLQGLATFGQDGLLEVLDSRGLKAEIGWVDGHVGWARCQHLRGEEALLACLFWFEGTYRFLAGKGSVPEGAELPREWSLTRFLLDSMFLADELEKRRSLVPPLAAPLRLEKPFPGDDPFGCGLDQVLELLQGPTAVTLERLERTLPLSPVKVRLAVAYLVEQGALPAFASQPASESSDFHSRWWARLASRHGGRFRVLVLADEAFANQESFSRVVSFLVKKLKAGEPWVSFSPHGPSFARLRPRDGGVLSLSFVACETMDDMDRIGLGIGQNVVVGVGLHAQACLERLRSLGIPTLPFATVEDFLAGIKKLE